MYRRSDREGLVEAVGEEQTAFLRELRARPVVTRPRQTVIGPQTEGRSQGFPKGVRDFETEMPDEFVAFGPRTRVKPVTVAHECGVPSGALAQQEARMAEGSGPQVVIAA